MRRTPLGIAGLGLALGLTFSAPRAHAGSCGGVPAAGKCVDAKTVEWCSGGEVLTATCPEGEVCAQHEAYGGGFGCVDKEMTACADVPDEGTCTTGNTLLWCTERGELEVEPCGEGETCAWDEQGGWYDCLPGKPGFAPPAATDGGGEDDGEGEGRTPPEAPVELEPAPREPDDTETSGDEGARGPTPTVEQGGFTSIDAGATPAGGCNGGPAGGAFSLLLAGITLVLRRR